MPDEQGLKACKRRHARTLPDLRAKQAGIRADDLEKAALNHRKPVLRSWLVAD